MSESRPQVLRSSGILFVLVAQLLLTGCDQQALFDRLIPKEEAEFAKSHLALYRSGDVDAVLEQLYPQIVDDETRGKVEAVMAFFPDEEPVDIVVVGSNTQTTPNSWSAKLTFQYEFPETFMLAVVQLLKEDDKIWVSGVNVQLLEASLQEMNAFRISGRGVPGYVFLALAVGIPVLIIWAFILCMRTPIPKRKWAWGIFVLFGFGSVSVNWTTGDFGYSLLSWQLLGSGFEMAGPYAPVIISIGFPFGAIVFLNRRKEWLVKSTEQEE